MGGLSRRTRHAGGIIRIGLRAAKTWHGRESIPELQPRAKKPRTTNGRRPQAAGLRRDRPFGELASAYSLAIQPRLPDPLTCVPPPNVDHFGLWFVCRSRPAPMLRRPDSAPDHWRASRVAIRSRCAGVSGGAWSTIHLTRSSRLRPGGGGSPTPCPGLSQSMVPVGFASMLTDGARFSTAPAGI